MAQRALSEAGGKAQIVAARFPHEQLSRVLELASEAGMSRSQFVRQAVADAVERAEKEGLAPP